MVEIVMNVMLLPIVNLALLHPLSVHLVWMENFYLQEAVFPHVQVLLLSMMSSMANVFRVVLVIWSTMQVHLDKG